MQPPLKLSSGLALATAECCARVNANKQPREPPERQINKKVDLDSAHTERLRPKKKLFSVTRPLQLQCLHLVASLRARDLHENRMEKPRRTTVDHGTCRRVDCLSKASPIRLSEAQTAAL